MTHAASSYLPQHIALTPSRTIFWDYVLEQLLSLIEDERNWVSNLSNASSIIYHSLRGYQAFGEGDRAVNWCGFYISDRYLPPTHRKASTPKPALKLLLGPFNGRPACQLIRVPNIKTAPGTTTGAGVCADAFSTQMPILVPYVDLYPGHIACDGETKSELVLPLFSAEGEVVGVLDLDCLAPEGFTEDDKVGLVNIANAIGKACDWIPSSRDK